MRPCHLISEAISEIESSRVDALSPFLVSIGDTPS